MKASLLFFLSPLAISSFWIRVCTYRALAFQLHSQCLDGHQRSDRWWFCPTRAGTGVPAARVTFIWCLCPCFRLIGELVRLTFVCIRRICVTNSCGKMTFVAVISEIQSTAEHPPPNFWETGGMWWLASLFVSHLDHLTSEVVVIETTIARGMLRL